jgi:hypothetical protein
MVAAAIRQAFLQTDTEAAHQTWRHVADQLRGRWLKLAALMDDSAHDVLAYLAFPAQHRTKLHSTNPLAGTSPGTIRVKRGSGCSGPTDSAAPAEDLFSCGRNLFLYRRGGFVALRSLKLPILTASVLSFVTATFVNTLLCCGFVFRTGRFSRREEIVRHCVIALVGLGLNSVVGLASSPNFGARSRSLPCFLCSDGTISADAQWCSTEAPPAAIALLSERVRGRLSS